MARAVFIKDDSFTWMMNELQRRFPNVSEKVLEAGSNIVADQIRENLEAIISPEASGELADAFGISPMQQDKKFNYNVHLGFDGYQILHYKFHTTKVPFQLLARSFESGAVVGGRYEYSTGKNGKFKRKKKNKSSFEYWRRPTPFAAPAVKKTRKQAEQAMIAAAEEEYNKVISESRNHK